MDISKYKERLKRTASQELLAKLEKAAPDEILANILLDIRLNEPSTPEPRAVGSESRKELGKAISERHRSAVDTALAHYRSISGLEVYGGFTGLVFARGSAETIVQALLMPLTLHGAIGDGRETVEDMLANAVTKPPSPQDSSGKCR